MVGWIVSRLKWFGFIMALSAWFLPYAAYTNAERETRFVREGRDAVGVIDGATQTIVRRRGASITVDLTWRNDKGQNRQAQSVSISSDLADKIIRDNKFVQDRLKIRYVPDDASAGAIVTENKVLEAREPISAAFGTLPMALPLSISGFALFYFLWRRGRQAA